MCLMYFEYDSNDLRPFIWHDHPDGTMVANDNPNLKEERRKYLVTSSEPETEPKHNTKWFDFDEEEAEEEEE